MNNQNGFNGQQGFNPQNFQQQGFNMQQGFQQQGFNPQQQNFNPQQNFQQQQDFNSQQDFQFQQNFNFQQQGFNQQPNLNTNLSPANIPKSKFSLGKIVLVILLIFIAIIGVGIYKRKQAHEEELARIAAQESISEQQVYNESEVDSSNETESNNNSEVVIDETTQIDGTEEDETEKVDVNDYAETGTYELKHGQNYNYVFGNKDLILLNDRVELFKKINVKDPKVEILKPSKGNVFLGIFLSVTNRSTDEDFINVIFKGYANDEEVKTVGTELDELEGYKVDSYITGESTKQICLLYEVPKKIKTFELRDDNGLILTISLLKDNAKGEEER